VGVLGDRDSPWERYRIEPEDGAIIEATWHACWPRLRKPDRKALEPERKRGPPVQVATFEAD
jgi:hypothetical protein